MVTSPCSFIGLYLGKEIPCAREEGHKGVHQAFSSGGARVLEWYEEEFFKTSWDINSKHAHHSCAFCGAYTVALSQGYVGHAPRDDGHCFRCDYWLRLRAVDDEAATAYRGFVVNGAHFTTAAPGETPAGSGRYQMLETGEILEGHFWVQGAVPTDFRELFPDTAEPVL